jgi:hypothetical protein
VASLMLNTYPLSPTKLPAITFQAQYTNVPTLYLRLFKSHIFTIAKQ